MISRVAFSSATVLITGEIGTGKELVARAIHLPRSDREFVVIRSAAVSKNLLESVCLGHVKGLLPALSKIKKVFSKKRMAGPCLWMRLVISQIQFWSKRF